MIQRTTAFQLKGSLFAFTILQLLNSDLEAIKHQLTLLAKQTPAFFKQTPIIIDLQKLAKQQDPLNLEDLKDLLRNQGLIPVGVLNATAAQTETAIAAGLALIQQNRSEPQEQPQSQPELTTKLVTQPVRSGQQVYARNGDLIVLASVSHGAELMADGHIHVYGTLRGRALAGMSGNVKARIFCQKLDAELVAIAGYYRLKDEIKPTAADHAIQIYFEDQEVKMLEI